MSLHAGVTLVLGLAAAHPFSSERLGHRTEVALSADRVLIDYRVEVPVRQILRELESAGETPEVYSAARLSELADGWLLKHDAALVPLERLPDPEDAAGGTSRFFSFHLLLAAPLPEGDGPLRLKLINENFPGPQSFHYVEVQVAPEVQVLASSLFDLKGGEVRNLREARWRMEEESRVTELLVQRDPVGPLERWLGLLVGDAGAPRYAHRAVSSPPLARLLAGQVWAGLAALSLVGALGLGLSTAGGRDARGAVGQSGAVLGLQLALWLLLVRFLPETLVAWIPLVGAALVVLAGAWLLRPAGRPSSAPGLAVVAAALALQQPALGLALAVAWVAGLVLGLAVGVPRRPRAVGAALVLVGAALVARGLGVLGLL